MYASTITKMYIFPKIDLYARLNALDTYIYACVGIYLGSERVI